MFSYSEIGKQLKKMWMSENIEILTKATIESNSDFALVLSEKELAMVRLENPLILTTPFRFIVTTSFRSKLTTLFRSMLTT